MLSVVRLCPMAVGPRGGSPFRGTHSIHMALLHSLVEKPLGV